jgi:hypothetical protein
MNWPSSFKSAVKSKLYTSTKFRQWGAYKLEGGLLLQSHYGQDPWSTNPLPCRYVTVEGLSLLETVEYLTKGWKYFATKF